MRWIILPPAPMESRFSRHAFHPKLIVQKLFDMVMAVLPSYGMVSRLSLSLSEVPAGLAMA